MVEHMQVVIEEVTVGYEEDDDFIRSSLEEFS